LFIATFLTAVRAALAINCGLQCRFWLAGQSSTAPNKSEARRRLLSEWLPEKGTDVQAGGKKVFTEAFDGKNGWESHDGSEPESASPKGTAALRHGVQLPGKLVGLHELRNRGHKVELTGREKIDGIDYYALRLILSDGYTTTLYVDPQSWLITRRRDVRPLHVDVDPTPTTIEQRSSDFREVSGVRFAFATTEIDLKTGKQLESAKVSTIKVNPPFDESIFEKL
jgi:hypothetical protein